MGSPARRRTMGIELFGQNLSVVSDNDPERVREIVAFVNDRLQTLKRGAAKKGSAEQVALLAALNIAEELFDARAQHEALERRTREHGHRVLKALDAVHAALPTRDAKGKRPSRGPSASDRPGSAAR